MIVAQHFRNQTKPNSIPQKPCIELNWCRSREWAGAYYRGHNKVPILPCSSSHFIPGSLLGSYPSLVPGLAYYCLQLIASRGAISLSYLADSGGCLAGSYFGYRLAGLFFLSAGLNSVGLLGLSAGLYFYWCFQFRKRGRVRAQMFNSWVLNLQIIMGIWDVSLLFIIKWALRRKLAIVKLYGFLRHLTITSLSINLLKPHSFVRTGKHTL